MLLLILVYTVKFVWHSVLNYLHDIAAGLKIMINDLIFRPYEKKRRIKVNCNMLNNALFAAHIPK